MQPETTTFPNPRAALHRPVTPILTVHWLIACPVFNPISLADTVGMTQSVKAFQWLQNLLYALAMLHIKICI